MASIAPCRWMTLSEAPRSGTTLTITCSITLLVKILLYTARQRPAMCRTAEKGCCRHWSRLSVEDSNYTNSHTINHSRQCCKDKSFQRTRNICFVSQMPHKSERTNQCRFKENLCKRYPQIQRSLCLLLRGVTSAYRFIVGPLLIN